MHEILSRLKRDFGIRCTALNWFRSYLSNRKYVLTDDQKSTETSLDFFFVCVFLKTLCWALYCSFCI